MTDKLEHSETVIRATDGATVVRTWQTDPTELQKLLKNAIDAGERSIESLRKARAAKKLLADEILVLKARIAELDTQVWTLSKVVDTVASDIAKEGRHGV